MTARRMTLYGLIVVLTILPVLGFATGVAPLSIWNKGTHPASGHHAPHSVWRITPGVIAADPGVAIPSPVAYRLTEPPVRLVPVLTSPPFVPPRA